jgi:hypothetical protein
MLVIRCIVVVKVAQAGCHTWKIYAKLRLKDLADLFEKAPLLKGSTMRFYINTNQSIVNFTATKAVLAADTSAITTNSILQPATVNVIGGLTNPLMIASNLLGQGTSGLPANTITADTYQLSVSIYRNNFSQDNNRRTIHKSFCLSFVCSCLYYEPYC